MYTCIFPIFISETEKNDIHLAENEPMVTGKTTAEPTLADQKENESDSEAAGYFFFVRN